MVHKHKRVGKIEDITLTLRLPERIDNWNKLSEYLWKVYNIDVDLSDEHFGELFWNPDLRSIMGYVEDFTPSTQSVRLFVTSEYYAKAFPKKWAKLKKKGV